MSKSGTSVIDADKYLELLDRLQVLEDELRQLGARASSLSEILEVF